MGREGPRTQMDMITGKGLRTCGSESCTWYLLPRARCQGPDRRYKYRFIDQLKNGWLGEKKKKEGHHTITNLRRSRFERTDLPTTGKEKGERKEERVTYTILCRFVFVQDHVEKGSGEEGREEARGPPRQRGASFNLDAVTPEKKGRRLRSSIAN